VPILFIHLLFEPTTLVASKTTRSSSAKAIHGQLYKQPWTPSFKVTMSSIPI